MDDDPRNSLITLRLRVSIRRFKLSRRTVRHLAAYIWCAVAGVVIVAAGFWFAGLWVETYLFALLVAFVLGAFVWRL